MKKNRKNNELGEVKTWPTLSEIAIAKNLLSGATQTEACQAAGYALSTSLSRSTEIVNRPGVQTALREALEMAAKRNLKLAVAETMVAGLDATKRNHAGDLDPDYAERRKSAETVAVFAGYKPAEQLDVTGESYHDRIVRLHSERGETVIDSDDDI